MLGAFYKPVGMTLIHGAFLVIVKHFLVFTTPWLDIFVIGGISVGLFALLTWVFDRSWLLRDMRLIWATIRGR